ncbi:MAG: XRE family transcriptional regulator [Ferruginibacter sp.]
MQINPSMIILAREYRGISQYELADGIGMSATNLSKIERGEISLQAEGWASIASQTNLPKQFFSQEAVPPPAEGLFRKREKVPQKLLDSILARGKMVSGHLQLLAKALQLPVPPLPAYQPNAAAMAAELAASWEMEAPVNGLLRLVENKGIAVHSWAFGSERIDSFSLLTNSGHPLICLNNALTGDRQRFSLAYELGRLCPHDEPNAFAAALLMPEQIIRPDLEEGITIKRLMELKQKWKLSMISLLYRSDDLGYLSPNQKRYLLQQFNQLGIRRQEPPELDVKPERPTLLRHLLGSYSSKIKMGNAELAAQLGLHLPEYLTLYA